MESFIIMFLLLSFPEFVLNTHIAFLLTRKGNYLSFKEGFEVKKTIHLFSCILFMSFFSACVQSINVSMKFILVMMIVLLAVKFFYNFDWKTCTNCTLIFAFTSLSAELITSLFYTNIANVNLITLDKLSLAIYSIPVRVLQLFVLLSLWRFDVLILNVNRFQIPKKIFYITITCVLFIETSLVYIYMSCFNTFNLAEKIIMGVTCFLCGVFNYSIMLLFVFTINSIVRYNDKGKE